jgi:hypothetical protein
LFLEKSMASNVPANIFLSNGREIRGTPNVARPFGESTCDLGSFFPDEVDVAAMMKHFLDAGYQVTYSVSGISSSSSGELNLARKFLDLDERNIICDTIRRRAIFDAVKHTVSLEVLTKSGKGVKDVVCSRFPEFDGGYDEWRDKNVFFKQTDARWWTSHPEVVMTKREHLPTLAEKKARSDQMHKQMEEARFRDGTESDLSEELRAYPRPSTTTLPERGDSINLGLQCSLEKPVAFDDKTLFRVRVQGLAGSDGAAITTRVFSGRDVRDGMEKEFKRRRATLSAFKARIDDQPCHEHSVTHCLELISGCAFFVEPLATADDRVESGKCLLSRVHVAWSSSDAKSRRLMLTGLMTTHLYTRPCSEADEDGDVCVTCLEPVTGEAWKCTTCEKTQHVDCFSRWKHHCCARGAVVTCPNCRAEVV